MSLLPGYWPDLATDYLTAYAQAFPSAGGIASQPSHRNALILAMSVAEHETNNGRAWPGQWNFGAVQLRGLTPEEHAAFEAGSLKSGDYTASRDGCLRVDTHPGPGGPVPYPIWFAAFPTRVDGIAYFLRALWRLSGAAPDLEDETPAAMAKAMYLRGYYEGAHHGARLPGHRTDPLTPPERSNVDDYGGAVDRCRATIEPALSGWDYGLDANAETAEPHARPTLPEMPDGGAA